MRSKNFKLYITLLIAGVVLFVIGGFILKGDELKSLSGVCIGAGAGLFGMSIAQLIQIRIADKNAAYRRKVDIEAKDERNVYIIARAKSKAFDVMGIVLGILMLVYILINAEMIISMLLIGAYLLVYGVYFFYLGKYTKEM